MKKIFFIAVLWLNIFLGSSQIPIELSSSCGMIEDVKLHQDFKSLTTGCSFINLYERGYDNQFIPLSQFPTYTIHVNFIFLQKADGSGNFQENNSEHQLLLNDLINHMNNTYSYLTNPNDPNCYPGSNFVSDAKIVFDVNKIYIRDNYAWNNQHGDLCPESPWYLDYLDLQIVNNPDIRRGINVYFTEDSTLYTDLVVNQTTTSFNPTGASCSQFPSFTNFSRTSKVHIPNKFSKYWYMKNICPSIYNLPWDPSIRNWYLNEARGFAHELGHSLWLFHNCPYYNLNGCFYSIMYQGGSGARNYLPPSEIGRIHASMSLSNIRTFLNEDTYNPIPQIITSTYNWNSDIRLYQDIKINSGGDLKISCKLTLPNQSDIRVQTNGKLSIENAIISSITNTGWNGIVVENGGYLSIKNTSLTDYSVTVQSGGTLIISEDLLIANNCCIIVESGGFICIETGANITLQDGLSLIILKPGYIEGVNTNIIPNPGTCLSNLYSIPISGNGSINSFYQNTYVQNETISLDRYITGNNIFIGHAVTTLKPQGDVFINSGANVIIEALENITFDYGFELQLGTTLETK